LDYMFNEENSDEIGELSHSLNQMTSNLKTVTASKADLEKEIAERIKIQEALSQSEQRLRRLYESGMLGVMYWNTDGRVEDSNDKFLEMTGYSREDLKAGLIDWTNMTPPEFRSRDERSLVELKSEGINKSPFEKEYIRKDGTRMPIIISGAMLDEERFHGVAFVLDITERKRAEESLKESEAKANALIKYAPTGIFEVDLRGPSFVSINDALCTLTGYTREELLALGPAAILDEESRKLFDDRIRRQLTGDKVSDTVEYRVKKKDGSLMYVVLNVLFPESRPGTVFVIGHDVTEWRKAEDEIQNYAKELEAHRNHLEELVSQRTRELQSLSYRLIMVQENERRNISRELHDQTGQSLTVTNLLLAKAQRSPETSKDDLQEAQQIIKEVMSQVRNLSSSLHPGMMEDLGLISTLNWYLNDFRKKTGIASDFEQSGFEGKTPPLDINLTIYRVIQEALTNIARYAEVEGAAVALQLKNRMVTIKVRDNGKGFDPDSQARGVGLRGMRERVNALNGKLIIQSTPGRGTVIEVEFLVPENSSPKG
jgi:PAS domain S-box-containing protein